MVIHFVLHSEYSAARPESKNLEFNAFLIKPLQRLCKYPLLLRELIKQLPERSAPRRSLELAQGKIEAAVTVVNERRREHEHSEKMFEIFKAVVSPTECEILSPTRRFVQEGDVRLRSIATAGVSQTMSAPVHYFLFNDLVS